MADSKKGKTVYSGGRPSQNSNSTRTNTTPQRSKKAKKKKKGKIVLFIVEILLLLILLAVFWVISKGSKIDYVDLKEEEIVINKGEDNKQIDYSKPTEEAKKGYKNIALFGVDARDKELKKNTRTDTIIIVSLNQDTGEVKMVSLYRDTYLNLGTDTYNKCNLAYFYGGAPQAINMLNMNLDLDIKDFVTVGFDGVIEVIDKIGGIEIDVKQNEISFLNDYQISMAGKPDGTVNAAGEKNYVATEGKDYIAVKQPGLQTLNGLQALAYMRIRYVGNDMGRTERQRMVITKVAEKAKKLNLAELNSIADAVLEHVSTSLKTEEIVELLAGAANYSVGPQTGFPFAGEYADERHFGSRGACLVPNTLEENVVMLHEFLFNETDYKAGATAKKCSDKIAQDLAAYNGQQ